MRLPELRDAEPFLLTDAGDAWNALAEKVVTRAGEFGTYLHRPLVEEKVWGGLTAETAAERLGRIRWYMNIAKEELAGVGTVLRACGEELALQQVRLRTALDDASGAGYKVADDGSVTAPTIDTAHMAPGDVGMMHRDQAARAQEYADRIAEAWRGAQAADKEYAASIKIFTDAANRCAKGDWSARLLELATASGADNELLTRLGMPDAKAPADAVQSWWASLSPALRTELIEDYPQLLGNRDGIPAADRDHANRLYLPTLLDSLETRYAAASGDEAAALKDKIEGVKGIQQQLGVEREYPLYLLGLGDEGNGRAIVSFGNPDTSQNVSAYVPGLNTKLSGHFASSDVERAWNVADMANDRYPDTTTASIVWLGYDAPQLDGFTWSSTDVMGEGDAKAGAPAYNSFLNGIHATHESGAPHVTAIGHSYGSLTVGQATQLPGGIPADDVVLVGSPGAGVDRAAHLGVGADHVYVGAAENDQVTYLTATPPGREYGGEKHNWFGTDPADDHFGGHHFSVAAGEDTGMWGLVTGNTPAHSIYFDPKDGGSSLYNIASVVAGHGEAIITTAPR
ncbi:alpha/beta hydrolase [Streptomyces sp. NBC_00525]|uniref:alpha/beta hydrolase n=1 Tax=Streptomyces sp. NBC_00525 TaxID=2903660 RepID=UPI002E81F413|nr:alpha/beta hydrolase [Streptomyces sp. NBC_00525]WUC93888.1 alpha/beta hydrolase family protein [Streptomyces sp. NBC_00525]